MVKTRLLAYMCVCVWRVCLLSHPAGFLHLQQDLFVLLCYGQRRGVDPLVDLLSLSGLEGVEAFAAVTHPRHNSNSV